MLVLQEDRYKSNSEVLTVLAVVPPSVRAGDGVECERASRAKAYEPMALAPRVSSPVRGLVLRPQLPLLLPLLLAMWRARVDAAPAKQFTRGPLSVRVDRRRLRARERPQPSDLRVLRHNGAHTH